MTCYHPNKVSRVFDESGKSQIFFSTAKASQFVEKSGLGKFTDPYGRDITSYNMKLRCGQCIGCRLEHSRLWAVRCVHHAKMYDQSCFVTLTFNNDFLPKSRSLKVRDFSLFMKRLRKRVSPRRVSYFHAGEYGDEFGRPHYHALIFNLDFDDKKLFMMRNGIPLYRSSSLEELWPFGYSTLGNVTFESAAYVARYCVKKITGDVAEDYYTYVDPEDGEVFHRMPEYSTQSNGIGKPWIENFYSDVYSRDSVVFRGGYEMRPPRYYDDWYGENFPKEFALVKQGRDSFLASPTYEELTRNELEIMEYKASRKFYEHSRGMFY